MAHAWVRAQPQLVALHRRKRGSCTHAEQVVELFPGSASLNFAPYLPEVS